MNKGKWAYCAMAVFMGALCCAACNKSDGLERTSVIENLEDGRYVNLYGRDWYNENLEGWTFANSASGFEVCFSGTELAMDVQVSLGGYDNTSFSVFLDGETDSNARVVKLGQTVYGAETVTLLSGLEKGEHRARVLKRIASNRSLCTVSRIRTDGVFLAAPDRPELRLDIYGDSITVGEGVMRSVTVDETTGIVNDSKIYTADTMNVFQSYAGVCARELGADFRVFGRGGIAMKYHTAADKFSVLENYKSMAVDLDVSLGACPEYDYTSWTPHAVVIYLGTNDYNRGMAYPELKYSDEGLKAAFAEFLNTVIGKYYGRDIPIFLCSNLMIPDSGLAEMMEDVKNSLKTKFPNLETVKFAAGITAPGGHPELNESEAAGKQLAAAVRSALGLDAA